MPSFGYFEQLGDTIFIALITQNLRIIVNTSIKSGKFKTHKVKIAYNSIALETIIDIRTFVFLNLTEAMVSRTNSALFTLLIQNKANYSNPFL